MRKYLYLFLSLTLLIASCKKEEGNINYKSNTEPLYRNSFVQLPLGAVKPLGWLRTQLELQAGGLTGHIDEYWPDLVNSSWRGGEGEAWERGPYYLDGLVPLAYLLEDEKLISKAKSWIDPIILSSSDSGWYGPAKNRDRWPLAVSNKVLMQYYEASGDTNALNVLLKYFRLLHDTPPDWPDKEWRGVRAMENAVTGYWLYRQTGEKWILQTIESIQNNSSDWTSFYEKFPWDSAASAEKRIPLNWGPDGLTAHVVNNAMAIKYPGLWYQQSLDERFRNAVFNGIAKYDLNHGQTGGRFSGDEHLSGKSPDRGTELCAVVEYMYSLEELYAIFGDNALADRLEMLAYNSLPGTTTADMWSHQYDQQSNQVFVSNDRRNWSTNGNESNVYGFSPNFGCCLANMHQGWPKFVSHMWMATNDNGLAVVAYGPSSVRAKVAKGKEVTIVEKTDYPFKGRVTFTIRTGEAVRFPLKLRIPGWADSVKVTYAGQSDVVTTNGEFVINRKWESGDSVVVNFPMELRMEKRYNASISLLRGPLYFALSIEKQYDTIEVMKHDHRGYMGSVDWQITPMSPWNYGLLIDKTNPGRGFGVTVNRPGSHPFADTGDMVWSEDSSKFVSVSEEAPVVITGRGMLIPAWSMKDNSADIPPVSPVSPQGDPVIIRLVPYGSAKLRITEFPVMDITLMHDVMRPSME